MNTTSGSDVAALLDRVRAGGAGALDELVGLLYRDLRVIAARRMRRERTGHTLQPTALVHEAFAKILADGTFARAKDRVFLHRAAARAMDQVLIDHQRKRDARKRAGRLRRTQIDAALDHLTTVEDLSVADLREALDDLARLDERLHLVVSFQFLLGMSQAEVADALGISQKTVERDGKFARGWLFERLKPGGDA